MKLYHYSNTEIKEIDLTKCDGFWMTTIAPHETDMISEIGASGLNYCHIVEFDDSGEELCNADNYYVEEQLEESNADFIRNIYDGFSDYAIANTDLVKIIQVIKI